MITVDDTQVGEAASVEFPVAVGVDDDRQDVMSCVLVVPAMVVTEVEVEVDTELPTDVENCVAVAELSHDISSTTIPLFRGFCELCSRGVEGKGREERRGRGCV